MKAIAKGPIFLKQLLEVARDLVAAEKAEEEGRLDEIKVVDPHRGALTQILEEYAPPDTPVIIESVVEQIDGIVRPIRGTGWQTSQPGDREVRRQLRLVLSRNGLPPQGDIFDRAYAYPGTLLTNPPRPQTPWHPQQTLPLSPLPGTRHT